MDGNKAVFHSLGKEKRRSKQMASFEDDDLAGLEDFGFDGPDDSDQAEFLHSETVSSGAPSGGRADRKRPRVDIESLPLMEGEGKSLRVLGFNQRQRSEFVQVLMRFGVGKFDWSEFVSRFKQKTYDEIENYGQLFLSHLVEEINDLPTFSDGVPKEGIRIDDVLNRVGHLLWIQDKVKCASDSPGSPLFGDSIIMRYPTLKGGRVWKQEHDLLLLHAVLKHGYTRWQAILDDKDLRIEEVICQELNLPVRSLSSMAVETCDLQKATVSQSNPALDVTPGGTDTTSLLFQFREMQRRQVEFVKNRVVLLGKGLDVEYLNKNYGDRGPADVDTEEPKNANNGDMATTSAANTSAGLLDKLRQVITAKEVHLNVYGTDPKRVELIHSYKSEGESDSKNNDQGLDLEMVNYEDSHKTLQERLNELNSSSLSYASDQSHDQSGGQSDDQREFSSSDDSGESDTDLGDLIKSASSGKSLEQGLSEVDSSLLGDGSDIQNDDQVENLSSGNDLGELINSASTDRIVEHSLNGFSSSLLGNGSEESDNQNDGQMNFSSSDKGDESDDDLDDLINELINTTSDKTLDQRLSESNPSLAGYISGESNDDLGHLLKSVSTGKTLEQRLNELNSSVLDYESDENSDYSDDLIKNMLINNASTGKTLDQRSSALNPSLLDYGSDKSNYPGDLINKASTATTAEQSHNELNSSLLNDGSGADDGGDDGDDGGGDDDDYDDDSDSYSDSDDSTTDSDFYSDDYSSVYDESDEQ